MPGSGPPPASVTSGKSCGRSVLAPEPKGGDNAPAVDGGHQGRQARLRPEQQLPHSTHMTLGRSQDTILQLPHHAPLAYNLA